MTLAPTRAAARIAWRQARRAPWRSALVGAMVALPIAALSGTAIVIQTLVPTPQERVAEAMGTADIVLQGWSDDLRPDSLLRELPTGTWVVTRQALYTQNIVRGSVIYLPMWQFSTQLDQPPLRGMLALLDGRAPAKAGEAALQPDALAAFGARIGDDILLQDAGLTLRVTGTIVRPSNIRDPIAVVGPRTLPDHGDEGLEGWWIDLPPSASLDHATAILATDPLVQSYATRSDIAHMDHGAKALANAGAFGGGALAPFGTGLIAAAAFVVGAQRQLRILGLIGAQGGEPRHVRATVVFGGVVLGLVGSAVGVTLGVAGAFALHPHLAGIVGKLVGPIELPPLLLVGSVALGTVAATLAALGPAMSSAKLSTVQALAGRMPQPREPGRLAVAGLLGMGVGVGLTSWGTARHDRSVLTIGLVLMVGGVLVAIPLLVTWVGRLAGYLPTIPRLSARDLARNGRRTGAALAAATIALALPITVSALTLSYEAGERRIPFMAPDQLSINLSAAGTDPERRAEALAADLRAAFPDSLVVPLVPAALAGRTGQGEGVAAQGGLEVIRKGVTLVRSGFLWIGGPDLLRAFRAEGGITALEAGKVVAVGPNSTDHGLVHVVVYGENGEQPLKDLPAVEAGATRYSALSNSGEYNYVISPAAAARAGLAPSGPTEQNPQFILRASGPLKKSEVARAKTIAARHPSAFVLSLGDLGSHNGPVRTILSLSGVVLALAILAVILALVGAESRRDWAILVAVGAEPRTRRALAGMNGFLIALLAGLLAVPAGLLPAVVYEASERIGNPIVVPWAAIAFVFLGVAVFAGTLAALGSREPDAAQMLRPFA